MRQRRRKTPQVEGLPIATKSTGRWVCQEAKRYRRSFQSKDFQHILKGNKEREGNRKARAMRSREGEKRGPFILHLLRVLSCSTGNFRYHTDHGPCCSPNGCTCQHNECSFCFPPRRPFYSCKVGSLSVKTGER